MKRCPTCRRDYYDDSLLYCLDDGSHLLEGPASENLEGPESASGQFDSEQQTALLSASGPVTDGDTKSRVDVKQAGEGIHETEETKIFEGVAEQRSREDTGDGSGKPGNFAHRATKAFIAAAVVLALVGTYVGYRYFTASGQIDSIAVMPFVNDSGNADVEYLSDGITETLIKTLADVPNLDVRPRSTVFRYKGKEIDPHILAKELKVRAVLVGRVMKRGQEIALFVELVDVDADKIVWSGQYRRDQSDIAALETQIVRDLTGKLHIELSEADRQKLFQRYTPKPEAYQLYLRGRHEWNKFSFEGLTKSVEYFERAIEADPAFALAYSGLADAYINLGVDYVSPKDIMPKARIAAMQAIALDDSLAEAHTSLGSYSVFYEWDTKTAEQEYVKAISQDAKYANARHFYSHCLMFAGRKTEAIREMKTAVELEPLSVVNNAELGWTYYLANEPDAAIEQMRRTIDLDPSVAYSYLVLGLAQGENGDYAGAIVTLKEGLRLSPDWLELQAVIAYIHAMSGNRAEAEALLGKLQEAAAKTYVNPVLVAAVYAALRDNDRAIEWLERGYSEKGSWMRWIAIEPQLALLRPDPRFQELVSRVNK